MLVFVLNQVLVYSSMCVMGGPSWHTLYPPLKTNETGGKNLANAMRDSRNPRRNIGNFTQMPSGLTRR